LVPVGWVVADLVVRHGVSTALTTVTPQLPLTTGYV
jgi:hypothetical protein